MTDQLPLDGLDSVALSELSILDRIEIYDRGEASGQLTRRGRIELEDAVRLILDPPPKRARKRGQR